MATNFDRAFASARKGGKKEFSFGGKKYNTKLKGEGGKSKKTKLPKEGPVPEKKPNSGPGRKPTGPRKSLVDKNKPAGPVQGPNKPKKSLVDKNKPAGAEQGPTPMKALGIAKKGSALSKAKARQDNKPKEKKTPGLFLLGKRNKAYKDR